MTERQPPMEVPSTADLLASILTVEGSFGRSYNRFHPYSLRNIGMLAMQGCPPEPVATYAKWASLGYHVKKGEKAYSILRPITIKLKPEKDESETAPEDEPDKPELMRRFKVVRALFHYAQVAGEGDLTPYVPPNWYEARAVEALNLREEPFAMYDGNVMGYSYDRTFAVSPVVPYPFKTKIHEFGHIELGHTTGETTPHRGIGEFQAESTAYLTLHQLAAEDQMDTSESRAYVQDWLSGGQPSETDIRQVFGVTDRIVRAGQIDIDQDS